MRRTPVVLAIVLFFALAAHADSVPILTASQGTMTVNALFSDVVGTVFYTFSGNGFSFAGFGTVGFDPYVVQGAPAGFGPLTASGGSVFGECCGSLRSVIAPSSILSRAESRSPAQTSTCQARIRVPLS